MSALNRKLNTDRKKRLSKDAVLLYQNACDLYFEELQKAPDMRDEALMEECLLLMKQSSSTYNWAVGHKKARPAHFLKRAAIAACAVIALLFAGAGVAYAFGIDVWQYFITNNKSGIVIEGTAQGSDSADVDFDSVTDTDGYIKCSSVSEAVKKLGIKPVILDLTNAGPMIDNIYVFKDSTLMELSLEYKASDNIADDSGFEYSVMFFHAENTAFTTSLIGEFDENEAIETEFATIYMAKNSDCITCAWVDDGYVYQIYSSLDFIDSDKIVNLITEAYRNR